ncbi:SpoIIE family protein phosphatase [Streptomyces sp. NPDC020983]|uniref:SpoIIE family protein phosphatase n=1 Tax=Streptomyces sp. NPDC020983 TaxID=3365106 RepID=UPI0037900CD8
MARREERHAAGSDLLRAAATSVGTTVEVLRTADELARAAVPGLADFAAVDLLDGVVDGDAPPPGPVDGASAGLRRAASCRAGGGAPGGVPVGAGVAYPAGSPYARSLSGGMPLLESGVGPDTPWLAPDARPAHALAALPLAAHGIVLGLLHLYRGPAAPPFAPGDLELAAALAAHGAVCLDNGRREARSARSRQALRHALLRDVVPAHPSMEHTRRYLPGRLYKGKGGSWCDVIALSSARVALVAGDATGHGVQAVARAGRARTAVRALLSMDLAPDELLTHLEHLVRQILATNRASGEPPGVTTTCLLVFYDPVTGGCQAASAGHPPPFLVRPDRPAEPVRMPVGPPFGEHGTFESVDLDLPEDGVLALYTRGVVLGPDGAPAPDTLARALARPADDLDTMAARAVEAVRPVRSGEEDGVLMLARPRPVPGRDVVSWEVPPEPASVSRARDLAAEQLKRWNAAEEATTTQLIVSELVTNAIRYGRPPLTLRLIRTDRLVCEVTDASSTSPHLRHAGGLDEGGRGLFLVAQLADTWGTRYTTHGKTIWAEQPLSG